MATVLSTKTIKHGKYTFIFELVSFDSGWDGFSDKWIRDVGLSVKVDYNNICTIYDELLITSGYSYDDEQSTEELLECLFNSVVNMQYLQDKANEKRLEMLENLQQNG